MENKTFIPGSEWVYFKLYTGTKTADAILQNELYRYVKELLNTGIIDKWFFIRYTDPDFHLRIRLHLKEIRNFTLVFNRFFEVFNPLINKGFVWDVQCNTYQREIERYGSNTVSLVEDLFFIDSEHIIPLLHRLGNDKSEDRRWKLALLLIDSFLSAFSFDMLQRKELLTYMADNSKKEFGFVHHNVTKQLNDKYRTNRKEIENAMTPENEILNVRRQAMIPFGEKLLEMEKAGELQVEMKALLTSLIHMTMNRWFRTKNRLHEMVIYEFLSRYYASEIAKKAIK
jgi:thiopeptide-type bacteriocin biosynthesis protein